jgi:replicative DNA helicase
MAGDLIPLREELVLPPSAPDMEAALLGCLTVDPSCLVKIADWLTAADFYRRDHAALFTAISTMVGRRQPVDLLTLLDWVDENGLGEIISRDAVHDLMGASYSAANVVAYAEVVLEKARLRTALSCGEAMIQKSLRPGADSAQIAADATVTLNALAGGKQRGGPEAAKVGMRLALASFVDRVRHPNGGLLGLPTPWRDLNAALRGLRPGVLYVVGGRPSMGKSILGLQIAAFTASRAARSLLFSVEMTKDECMGRAICCLAEVPHAFFEGPDLSDPDADLYCGRIERYGQSLQDVPLLIDDTPGITIDQLMARARREHQHDPLQLLVIDHMHDMGTDRKAEARHEYGRIAQGAKTLAKEMGIPVVLLAQLNRASTQRADKRPNLADLRESGEIEQKADVVLFVHREDYYDPACMTGCVEIIMGKGRNLRLSEPVVLKNSYDQMRLDDWVGSVPPRSMPKESAPRGFR